ncbi:hypothetical protein ACHAL6_00485 [Proteiniclasticum sp. C24MP]|uniref:hypothetical protein n=1 Tax=Proteiniclasticum sp. C24MP TaxID=3374101 RepID=UPI0037553CB3
MNTWNRNGYVIEERQYSNTLNKFSIVVAGEDVDEIIPEDQYIMHFIRKMLDEGEDIIGWEGGSGDRINLTSYAVLVKDKYNEWAESDTLIESYSKKQVLEFFDNKKLNENDKIIMGYYDENNEFTSLMVRTS